MKRSLQSLVIEANHEGCGPEEVGRILSERGIRIVNETCDSFSNSLSLTGPDDCIGRIVYLRHTGMWHVAQEFQKTEIEGMVNAAS